MHKFFSIPEKDYLSYPVFVFTIIWPVITGAVVSIGFYFFPESWLRGTAILTVSIIISVINLALNRSGYTHIARWSLTIMVWLYITLSCYYEGTVTAPGIISQMSVIVIAGFLLGSTGGLIFSLLSMSVGFMFAYLEIIGKLPEPSIMHNSITQWMIAIISFSAMLFLQYYATKDLPAAMIAFQNVTHKREGEDITKDEALNNLEQRKRATELRDYKFALDVASIVSISGSDGIFTFVNENFSRISGYNVNELLGKHHSILWSGYHPPEYFEYLKIAMEDGKPFRGEFCNKTKGGTLYWVDTTIVPFLDEDGNAYQYLSINHNITDRKEAEEKIKQSEERYKSIITVSNGGAWEYNWDTNQIWYSAEYFAMLGINRPDGIWDESMEATWIERLHPEDRERAIRVFDDYLKSDSKGLYESFFRMRHENENWVWVWSRGRRLCDANGNLTNITLGSHIDITERINAEEKIKQSERLLRKITSNIPCNTYMFEIEESGRSNMLFMNLGVEELNHNYTIDELSRDPQKVREIIHDDDKAKFNDAMKEAYRTQSTISVQYRVAVSGHIRWRWFQAVPERNEDGKHIWYGATSDITPLVEYIASIEQILFDISHVIRRPLSTMLGITELITESDLTENEFKDYSQKLFLISKEMDDFIQVLSRAYHEKKESNQIHIDFSSTVDRRAFLFK